MGNNVLLQQKTRTKQTWLHFQVGQAGVFWFFLGGVASIVSVNRMPKQFLAIESCVQTQSGIIIMEVLLLWLIKHNWCLKSTNYMGLSFSLLCSIWCNTHPNHSLFILLPSGKRFRSICCHTTRGCQPPEVLNTPIQKWFIFMSIYSPHLPFFFFFLCLCL